MSIRRASVIVALAVGMTAPVVHAQAPLPLDPLTPPERAVAESVARGDRRVREALGAEAQLVSIQFVAPKAADAQLDVPARRHAEVLFFLPPSNAGLAVLVDLEGRQVVDLVRAPGESVPLSGEEVERAVRLALADRRVVQLFDGVLPGFRPERLPPGIRDTSHTRVEAIRTLATGPGDPCYRRRCVVLFFRVENRFMHLNRVVVDLLSNRVFVRVPEG